MSDSIKESLAASVLRLGNECRDLAISNAVLRQNNEELQAENACLKAEIERLRKATEWQPIETAPFKKNIRIIICTFDNEVEIIYSTDLCHYPVSEYPEHWMPVPKPPKEGKPSV